MFATVLLAAPLLPFIVNTPITRHITVIEHVRVIDGTGRAPIENATVVIDGDKIVSVSTKKPLTVAKGAKVIDATGETLMPGIINAHGHLGLVEGAKNSATAYTEENV